MTNYKNISIKEFTYNLPDEKIAKYPLQKRDSSKLLILKNEEISETKFENIDHLLKSESLIIFNNTKVIQARLNFKKETGARIEVFCLEPHIPADYEQSFQAVNKVQWKCIIGNARKWKKDKIIAKFNLLDKEYQIQAEKIQSLSDAWIIEFTWNGSLSFSEIIENTGQTPIPPYLNRKAEESDKTRYQTIYSKHKGSVAAPTAGLHFTEEIITKFKQKNIKISELSLHVGAGTFKPVKAETIGEHEMHTEFFIINKQVIEDILKFKGKTTAVGTTSVRTLESIYWLGVKLLSGKYSEKEIYKITQWEAYELENTISLESALNAILEDLENKNLDFLEASTQIMIVPGYEFKIVNQLITNFHQPQSTLLLLISAFIGEDWKKVYQFALQNNFRFLSYGDSSLFEKAIK